MSSLVSSPIAPNIWQLDSRFTKMVKYMNKYGNRSTAMPDALIRYPHVDEEQQYQHIFTYLHNTPTCSMTPQQFKDAALQIHRFFDSQQTKPLMAKMISNQLYQWQFNIAILVVDINNLVEQHQSIQAHALSDRKTKEQAIMALQDDINKLKKVKGTLISHLEHADRVRLSTKNYFAHRAAVADYEACEKDIHDLTKDIDKVKLDRKRIKAAVKHMNVGIKQVRHLLMKYQEQQFETRSLYRHVEGCIALANKPGGFLASFTPFLSSAIQGGYNICWSLIDDFTGNAPFVYVSPDIVLVAIKAASTANTTRNAMNQLNRLSYSNFRSINHIEGGGVNNNNNNN